MTAILKPTPTPKKLPLTIITDPVQAAKTAGLRYVMDSIPGIRRKRHGKSFSYVGVDGKPISEEERDRIKSLVIPPALEDVWICPIPHGHLQATGRDAKGRKQYRYHPHWQKIRSETKFNRMIPFSSTLPLIREQVDHHLSLNGLPREKVLATVVHLLETTCIRVGNTEYAQENKSFGLTTLRNRHVDVSGNTVRFQFKGKSGVKHNIKVNDRRLAKVIKRCQDLPGYELFQYIDDEGKRQTIDSEDVNDYLRQISGEDFTAKDFRTWAGTILVARELRGLGAFETQTQAKKNVTEAIKTVSQHLGNRPATCRKYYVHPAVIEAYLAGDLGEVDESIVDDSPYSLQPEEVAVVALLEKTISQVDDSEPHK